MARILAIRGVSRRLAVSGTVLATVAGGLTIAMTSTGTAFASGCDFTNGKTDNLSVSGGNGLHPVGNTFTMPSGTSCKDLNLSFVSATDHYEGWLQNSKTGLWAPCMAKFVSIKAGHQSTKKPPVLCTGVSPTTVMAVVQESATIRSITVED